MPIFGDCHLFHADAVDGDAADWLNGLLIALAGRLRLAEAAPLLWDCLAVGTDWFREEVTKALTRIGTPAVVRLARERYRTASWDDRLIAIDCFAAIRGDDAGDAIDEMLDIEDDHFLRAELGRAAAVQFDDRLMPLARRVHDENPRDPERGEIRRLLVGFAHLAGWNLPERDAWNAEIDADDESVIARREASLARAADWSAGDEDFQDDPEFDDDNDDQPLIAWGEPTAETPIRREPRVGRNGEKGDSHQIWAADGE